MSDLETVAIMEDWIDCFCQNCTKIVAPKFARTNKETDNPLITFLLRQSKQGIKEFQPNLLLVTAHETEGFYRIYVKELPFFRDIRVVWACTEHA